MSKKELSKRYALFIIGLLFSGIGVAVTKRGELGVSPISSVANVISYKIPALSLGTWLLIWNCVLLLGQIVVLRRKFQPIQFLQIPLSVLFGWFTDFGLWVASYIPNEIYVIRLLLVITGIIILAFKRISNILCCRHHSRHRENKLGGSQSAFKALWHPS